MIDQFSQNNKNMLMGDNTNGQAWLRQRPQWMQDGIGERFKNMAFNRPQFDIKNFQNGTNPFNFGGHQQGQQAFRPMLGSQQGGQVMPWGNRQNGENNHRQMPWQGMGFYPNRFNGQGGQ